jgi:hypothetical protein
MKKAILPTLLSAFVWPGAGQLYNREFKKGWLLIGVSVLVTLSFSLNLTFRLKESLPTDIEDMDTNAIRTALQQMMANPSPYFRYFNIFMSILWAYAVVDAFVGALGHPGESDETPPPDRE